MFDLPPEIIDLGVAGILFAVWVYTFKYQNSAFVKVSEAHKESINDLARKTASSYETAIEDSRTLNKELLDLIRENAKEEQQIKSHLIRVLTRMEEKLDQPVRCPAAISIRKSEAGNG